MFPSNSWHNVSYNDTLLGVSMTDEEFELPISWSAIPAKQVFSVAINLKPGANDSTAVR